MDKIFIGYDCRSFPLGLNALDNARENEIRLQLYKSYKQGRIYRCGEFDYRPVSIMSLWFLTNFHEVFPIG